MRIITASRRHVDPLNLAPADVDAWDIAVSLARLPRFLGHTPAPITVAQHCVLVARLTRHPSPAAKLAALLHDAHEAYLGDVPAPIRPRVRLEDGRTWERAERDAQKAVYRHFGLPGEMRRDIAEAVAAADTACLHMELAIAMAQPHPPEEPYDQKSRVDIEHPWSEAHARQQWLAALDLYADAATGGQLTACKTDADAPS